MANDKDKEDKSTHGRERSAYVNKGQQGQRMSNRDGAKHPKGEDEETEDLTDPGAPVPADEAGTDPAAPAPEGQDSAAGGQDTGTGGQS